jgi:hypothetical protein
LTTLVDWMLAKQPAHRPADAREVYDRLIVLVGRTPVRPDALMDPTRPFRDPLATPARWPPLPVRLQAIRLQPVQHRPPRRRSQNRSRTRGRN